MRARLLLCLTLAALLAACAGGPARKTPAPVETRTGETDGPRSDPRPVPAAPDPAAGAVSELLAEARSAREAGRTERALALLERAQRLQPARGSLYLELARTHAAAGDQAQAKAFAERGLLYCRGSECAALAPFTR